MVITSLHLLCSPNMCLLVRLAGKKWHLRGARILQGNWSSFEALSVSPAKTWIQLSFCSNLYFYEQPHSEQSEYLSQWKFSPTWNLMPSNAFSCHHIYVWLVGSGPGRGGGSRLEFFLINHKTRGCSVLANVVSLIITDKKMKMQDWTPWHGLGHR